MATTNELFTHTLKGVSRSFYLTLRVLPTAMRQPIGLAYLLARAADTLSDTTAIPHEKRSKVLHLFRDQLVVPAVDVHVLSTIQACVQGRLDNAHEQTLLQRLPELFTLLHRQSGDDKEKIITVVRTLTSGMVFDLDTFPMEESGDIGALTTSEELDRYTYLVAGCVGEFWTQMSVSHVPALKHWDKQSYAKLGIRLGKALQLTNILRDVAQDLRIGRCYLPIESLSKFDLSVAMLKNATQGESVEQCLHHYISIAAAHYMAAIDYVLGIPRHCIRLRLAALWPMLIGIESLLRLKQQARWLDPNTVCKVDRSWVYRMLATSTLQAPSNSLVRRRLKKMLGALNND